MDFTLMGLSANQLLEHAALLAVTVLVTAVVVHFATRGLRHLLKNSNVPSASIFINIARAFIWALALLFVLEPVFGINPTAFVTALGVTSLVISLGMQDTVSNLIGGIGLMACKVIQPGDFVSVSGFSGKVTDINWRNTTVRDRNGNEQVIPNSVLNKTALTCYDDAFASRCDVHLLIRHGSDVQAVATEICRATHASLENRLFADMDPDVMFVGSNNYGIECTVYLYVKEGITFDGARNAFTRQIANCPWLADER